MAVALSKKFFKLMVQPCDQHKVGVSLWGIKEIEEYNLKRESHSAAKEDKDFI